ncbi:hypothetical protein ABIA33_006051 [Streptacidiphilus sp. MAP12-16]|uniref:hypothetical protein n=1 Tax=Streptacidiphilus sp. MAP12-16 TaxID=3156300 RepID=UPI003514F5E6
MPEGLLVHLVDQFITRREQVATEGLYYLARHYPEVRKVLGSLSEIGAQDEDRLVYRPEAAGGQGRPDLLGELSGQRWVVVAGTSWADLTDAQPCGYLRGITSGGVVLFLSPARRVTDLCRDLAARVQAEGLGQDDFAPDGTGLHVMTTSARRHLVVTTWPVLLQRIRRAAGEGSAQLIFEVDQLQGVVGRLENDLVEWSRAELEQGVTRTTFRKAVTTAELLFDVLARTDGVTTLRPPKWVDRNGVYYRSGFSVGPGVTLFAGFEPERWDAQMPTPLTFGIWSPDLAHPVRQRVYQVYLDAVGMIWKQSGEPFDNVRFWPAPESDNWWWGPIPLASDRPAEVTRSRLASVLAHLVDNLARL